MGRNYRLLAIPLVVTVTALSVLFGWVAQIPMLVQLHPEFAPMQFNTALCFLLLSLSTITHIKGRLRMATGFACLAFLLAGATGLQYLLNIELGIDNLFVDHQILTKTSHAGRMAPNTSLVFCILSTGFLISFLSSKSKTVYVSILACTGLALLLSLSALYGYLFSIESVYGWSKFTRMALHTATADLLLAIQLFLICKETDSSRRYNKLTWQVPLALLIGCLISLLFYKKALGYEAQVITDKLESDAHLRATLITNELKDDIAKLASVERFFAASNFVDVDEFAVFTRPFLQNDTSILAIDWSPRVMSEERKKLEKELQEKWGSQFMQLDENRKLTSRKNGTIYYPVVYTVPLEFPKKAIGFDHYSDPLRTRAMDLAAKLRRPVSTEPFQLFRLPKQTSKALDTLIVVPVFKNNLEKLEGYVIGVFRLSQVIHRAIESWGLGGLEIELRAKFDSGDLQSIYVDRPLNPNPLLESLVQEVRSEIAPVVVSVNIAERDYELIFRATPVYLSANVSVFPMSVLLSCGLLTLITSLYVYYVSSQRKELIKTLRDRANAMDGIKVRERRFSQLAASAPIGIFRTDPDGNCEYVNPAWLKLAGLEYEQALGVGWGSSVHPEDKELVLSSWESAIKNETNFSMEFRFLKPDGSVTWVAAKSVPVTREDGTVTGFVGTNFDLTKNKELIDQASAAAKAKSEFLANMSHEIRTPMNSIIGFTKRLLKKPPKDISDQQLDALETIDRNAKQLLVLINDILDLSKIESGKTKLELTEFNALTVVTDVVENLQPLAETKSLELTVNFPEKPVTMLADQQKLRQALTNLCSNAIKYTDSGSVEVSVLAKQETIEIAVQDTGIGIREDDLPKLFSSFIQLEDAKHRREGGTGLGLRIAKEYVEMHNGLLAVKSEHAKGSTFKMTIPIRQGLLQSRELDGPQRSTDQVPSILLLETDNKVASIIEKNFEQDQVKVISTRNAEAVLEEVTEHVLSTIIIDLSLLVGDPQAYLKNLASINPQFKIPVVLLTDSDLPEEERAKLKPFTHEVFQRDNSRFIEQLCALISEKRTRKS